MFFSLVRAQTDIETPAAQLLPREKYNLTLPKISVSIDYITKEFDGVRITFAGSNDQVYIGIYDDMYMKSTSFGNKKTLYSETPEKATFLSKFEVKYLTTVNRELIATLDDFDNLLQQKNWPRCRYLDAYFPNFLNGYYYLMGAVRSTACAFPRGARIPEQVYDVSLNSQKTDTRINQWQFSLDYIIKLRIAAKELSHQLRLWQKSIDKATSGEDVVSPKELEEAFVIFIRVYFNLKPPSPVMIKKQG